MEAEQHVDGRAERVAQNEALFRKANEQIAAEAERFASRDDDELPFLCECSRGTCTDIVRLTLPLYRSVRSNRRRFVCIPGHVNPADGFEHVVDEQPGYVVIEKRGAAGELVERLA